MPTALLVANNQARTEAQAEVLAELGFTSIVARDGDEAFDILHQDRPIDLVVTELSLARTDGFSLLRTLPKVPGRESVPCVVISAFDTMLVAANARRAELHASALLSTRASREQIIVAVRHALAGVPTPFEVPSQPDAALEATRIARIDALGITKDPALDPELQALVADATKTFAAPVGLVSIVETDRQWFKSHVGLGGDLLEKRETPRAWAFCDHVVHAGASLVVPDARENPTFADNPLVVDGSVRGYAGAPITTPDGLTIGTLCVLDGKPLELKGREVEQLEAFARHAAGVIQLRSARRRTKEQAEKDGPLSDLRAVLQEVPFGLLLIGPDGKVALANRVLADLSGMTIERIEAMSLRDWVRASATFFDDPTAYLRMVRALPNGPFVVRQEWEVQRPRRRVIRWISTPVPLVDGVGQLLSYVDITTDRDLVTEREQHARELAARESLLSALFERAPLGIVVIDEKLAPLRVNARFESMLGLKSADRSKVDYASIIIPGEHSGREAMIAAMMQRDGLDRLTAVRRCRHADGHDVDLQSNTSIVRDDLGNFQMAISVVEDITESRRLRDSLRRSEAEYRALARNLPNAAVLLFDKDLRYVVAEGDALLSAAGHDRVAMVGRTMPEVALPENVAAIERVYRAALDGDLQKAQVSRAGRTFEMHTAPVRDESGAILSGMAIAYDVTDRVLLELQLRKQGMIAAVQASVAVAANEAQDLRGAVQTALNLLCAHTDWVLGHAFFASGNDFVPSGIWNVGSRGRFTAFKDETARSRFVEGVGVVGEVARDREAAWLDDVSEHRFLRHASAETDGLRSAMFAPVLIDTEVVAVLELYTTKPTRADQSLLGLMSYTGVQLGRVVERARGRAALEERAAQLTELSLVDELTSLNNRRGFLTLGEQQLTIARREHRSAYLVFADLDGMKRINDELGHEMGDRAIVETAQLLRNTLRRSDVVARLGGDEFVALAVESQPLDVDVLLKRLQRAVDVANEQPERPFKLSVSFGITRASNADGEALRELLQRADQLMYEQKVARRAAGTLAPRG